MEVNSILIKIIERYKDDSDIIYMISELIKKMGSYMSVVSKQYALTTIDKYNMPKEDLLEEIKKLDMLRYTIHNTIISDIKFVNKLCDMESINRFFKGNEDDRREVGEFVIQYTSNTCRLNLDK